MAFGENSGVVGGGIGQGFGQGAQDFSRNYQTGVQQRKEQERFDTEQARMRQAREDQLAQIEYGKAQDALNRDERSKNANRDAAQNALNLKVGQFRELVPPQPPQTMDPALWDQWNKDYAAWFTTRQRLAGDVDALMEVSLGEQKNPDGTPMTMKSFSEIALGTSRADLPRVLAETTQRGTQLSELLKTQAEKQEDLKLVVSQGGTRDNPEYTRLQKEIDGLTGQIGVLYKQQTGLDYKGGQVDYAALEKVGNARGQADMTTKALMQFSENPLVGGILQAANQQGKVITFTTPLVELGLDAPGTVGDAFKVARGELTLEAVIEQGDMKKALAIYAGMTPQEKAESPAAANIATAIDDPNNTVMQAAIADLKIPVAQLRNTTLQGNAIEKSLEDDWQKLADTGDQTMDGRFEEYRTAMTKKGMSPENISLSWANLIVVRNRAELDKTTQSATGVKALENLGYATERNAFGVKSDALDYERGVVGLASDKVNLDRSNLALKSDGVNYERSLVGLDSDKVNLDRSKVGLKNDEVSLKRNEFGVKLDQQQYDRGEVALSDDKATLRSKQVSLANTYGQMAIDGNPNVLGMRDAFEQDMRAVNPNITEDQLDTAWKGIVGKYNNRTEREITELTLAKQAVTTGLQNLSRGTIEKNKELSQLINSGDLYVLDESSMGGEILKMFISAAGGDVKKGTAAYRNAVNDSETQFGFANEDKETALAVRREQIRNLQNTNSFDEASSADRLKALTLNNERGEEELAQTRADFAVRNKTQKMEYFMRGAQELGSGFLNSANAKSLAKEWGIDITTLRETGEFTDWARGDKKRSSSLDEFYKLVANPAIAVASPNSLRRLASSLGLDYNKLYSNLLGAKNRGIRLDAAQVNNVITNTWATKERVAQDKLELTYSRTDAAWEKDFKEAGFQSDVFRWKTEQRTGVSQFNASRSDRNSQYNTSRADQNSQWQQSFDADNAHWKESFKQGRFQWESEMRLKKLQTQWGMDQDMYSNSMKLIDNIRQDRQFALQLGSQDKATLATYAGTLRDSVAQASAFADDYGRRVKELEANAQVAPHLPVVKLVDGSYTYTGTGEPNSMVQEYIAAKNGERNARDTARAGMSEMNELKGLIKPSTPNTAANDLYGAIFGESRPGATGTNWNMPGGNTATLSPAFRNAVKSLPGKQGAFVQAALASLDGGLTDFDGTNVAGLPNKCSTTLRILAQRVGVNRDKYFGGTAAQTWGLLKKNGEVINSGKPLTVAGAAKQLQPGDMLYWDLPNNGTDHVAMYIGNGLVYQHNSQMKGSTGASGGNINVVPLDKFVKIAPTFAARIPEVASSTTTKTTTTKTSTQGNTSSTGSFKFTFPTPAKGSYQPNKTRVGNNDLLGTPAGNGMYNLVTDRNAALNIVVSVNAQLMRGVDGYSKQPEATKIAALTKFMRSKGYAGNIEVLAKTIIQGNKK